MAELQVAHTADLPAGDLRAIRVLLAGAFEDGITEDDYEHALGGLHALIWDGPALIGHGSVVMRRLLHEGRALRTGYVEGVAVRADQRRRGHGGTLMTALERVIRSAYELGALSASDDGALLYPGRGWQPWTGTASVIAPGGMVRTEVEEGTIYVLPGSAVVTLDGDLACDWRGGDLW